MIRKQNLTKEYVSSSVHNILETIIDYLTQNGVMDAVLLYEPPFTDLHCEGLDSMLGFSIKCGKLTQTYQLTSTIASQKKLLLSQHWKVNCSLGASN